jgi:hypothetical protein
MIANCMNAIVLMSLADRSFPALIDGLWWIRILSGS